MTMNNSVNMSPCRPLPTFFLEQTTFSTKKERETPKLNDIYPPRPPIKSCPPISRLRALKNLDSDRARVISFADNNANNNNHLLNSVSKNYDENKTDSFFEQCFIIEGSLGCGSFGKVYKVKSKEDGQYYAVKKSREKFKGKSDRDRRLEEVAKHEQLPAHPNCVKFYRAWEEKQRLYICLELCKTSLSSYASNHHNIPESVIWRITIDLLEAVNHLHSRHLVHMDIKPDNIFISHDGVCKLGDFGLVIDLKKNDLKEAIEGDPKYLAPEVLQNCNNIKCAADIFSLGMTILELATDLDLPRSGELWHQLRMHQVPADLISMLSNSLIEIIMKMIEPDHLKRSTAEQLLQMRKNFSATKLLLNNVNNNNNNNTMENIFYTRTVSCLIQLKDFFYNLFVKFWCYALNPWCFFTTKNNNNTNLTKLKTSKSDDRLNLAHSDQMEHTSTPTKINHFESLMCFVHTDDEDIKDHNDSFSTNNNSYVNPIIDSTSSSFSDESDISTAAAAFTKDKNDKRNSKTEPPKKKTNYLKINNNNSNNNNNKMSSSPCKTPPWKPMSSLYAYNTDNTPVGPTRLKFDDYDLLIQQQQPAPPTLNPYFVEDHFNTNPVPDESLCLKLSFK